MPIPSAYPWYNDVVLSERRERDSLCASLSLSPLGVNTKSYVTSLFLFHSVLQVVPRATSAIAPHCAHSTQQHNITITALLRPTIPLALHMKLSLIFYIEFLYSFISFSFIYLYLLCFFYYAQDSTKIH